MDEMVDESEDGLCEHHHQKAYREDWVRILTYI